MGKLVCIGGGEIPRIKNGKELPYETKEIDEEIVRISGKQNPNLLFIGTASSHSYDYFLAIKKIYKALGCIVSNLDLFKEGYFTIQDEGAGKIGLILNPKEGEEVLDACSAPGGKTTHLAEIMKNKGHILAWDIHQHRVNLVEENAKRLGVSIIELDTKDACEYDSKYDSKFDKILLDVPCMGLGVCKRKPDIKWQKKETDIEEITKIQIKILQNCFYYLKKGGNLVYSTCSILKDENEDIIKLFVEECRKNNQEIKILESKKIIPNTLNDGFYMCKICKEL